MALLSHTFSSHISAFFTEYCCVENRRGNNARMAKQHTKEPPFLWSAVAREGKMVSVVSGSRAARVGARTGAAWTSGPRGGSAAGAARGRENWDQMPTRYQGLNFYERFTLLYLIIIVHVDSRIVVLHWWWYNVYVCHILWRIITEIRMVLVVCRIKPYSSHFLWEGIRNVFFSYWGRSIFIIIPFCGQNKNKSASIYQIIRISACE